MLPLIHPTGQHDHNGLKGIEHLLRHLVIVSSRLPSIASVLPIRVFGPYGITSTAYPSRSLLIPYQPVKGRLVKPSRFFAYLPRFQAKKRAATHAPMTG